jgi:hypothetical protein
MKLPNINNDVYEYLFPSLEVLNRIPNVPYETNNIFQRQLLVVGGQQSGKTITAKAIAIEAIIKYGEDNVRAVSSRDFKLLMDHGIKDKMVNILFFDDATLTDVPKKTLRDYFRIRHIMKSRTGRSNGLVVTMVGTHRFHSMPKELRSTCNIVLWKSPPTNPYDRTVALQFVKEQGLTLLESIELQKQYEPELLGICVAYFLNDIGLFITPQPRVNYMVELVSE